MFGERQIQSDQKQQPFTKGTDKSRKNFNSKQQKTPRRKVYNAESKLNEEQKVDDNDDDEQKQSKLFGQFSQPSCYRTEREAEDQEEVETDLVLGRGRSRVERGRESESRKKRRFVDSVESTQVKQERRLNSNYSPL